jgi:hypothetical protein
MNRLTLFFFLFCCRVIEAQNPEQLVNSFFKSMSDRDTVALKKFFTKNATLQTSTFNKIFQPQIGNSPTLNFISTIGKFPKGALDERISNIKVNEFPNVASVSMDYAFYLNGKFSHQGVNLFSFLKEGKDWKIASIVDSRSSFKTKKEEMISQTDYLLDFWHAAAAKADSASFFGLMHDESIYVGTDSFEVWDKPSYLKFAAPYFAKGKAWSFTKASRNIRVEEALNLVWFDEVLNTWMGLCRGSGFLIPDESGNLKIKHYVLSVIIPNDKIYDVMKVNGVPKK